MFVERKEVPLWAEIIKAMFTEQVSTEFILFFILYGITGVIPFVAALYLLLRRGNAFAPEVTPPARLRHWTASYFAVAALGHVWWFLFYIYNNNIHTVTYVVVVILDCVSLLITIAGTSLAMLQDRHRPVWPVVVALIPFVVFCGTLSFHPSDLLKHISSAYILLLYFIFTIYMVVSIRKYGRWLNDNYADLENKKVWLTLVVTLLCMLLFIIYVLVSDIFFIYFLHIVELLLFGLLLWRVETLPQLPTLPQQPTAAPITIDLAQIEQLLEKHCVSTQLYLQHDLTLQQLAQAIGTNRSYLSQYFSRQSITYNSYINNLRINHFISRCQELTVSEQPVSAQQLAQESGFRSYSTFSRAFAQRTGQTVTAWMRDRGE